jgi:hypothetical protein
VGKIKEGDRGRVRILALAAVQALDRRREVEAQVWDLGSRRRSDEILKETEPVAIEKDLEGRVQTLIEATEFPPRKGGYCATCPAQHLCPLHRDRWEAPLQVRKKRRPREISMALAVRLLGDAYPRYRIRCPCCPDPPFLIVSPQGWECPECGRRGGAVELVMAVMGTSRRKAIRILETSSLKGTRKPPRARRKPMENWKARPVESGKRIETVTSVGSVPRGVVRILRHGVAYARLPVNLRRVIWNHPDLGPWLERRSRGGICRARRAWIK